MKQWPQGGSSSPQKLLEKKKFSTNVHFRCTILRLPYGFKTAETWRNQERTNPAAVSHHQKVKSLDSSNSLVKKRNICMKSIVISCTNSDDDHELMSLPCSFSLPRPSSCPRACSQATADLRELARKLDHRSLTELHDTKPCYQLIILPITISEDKWL